MGRERISSLQKRLLSYKRDQSQKFADDYLISIAEPFDRLREQFVGLFNIDLEEGLGNGAFQSTPAELRSVLDELLIIAEIWDINLEKAVWGKYPDECPYCLEKPCRCTGGKKSNPHKRLRIRFPKKGLTIGEAQQMLAEIYPRKRSICDELLHALEEIDETETEIVVLGTDRDKKDEFADAFARISQLATHLGICLEGLIP